MARAGVTVAWGMGVVATCSYHTSMHNRMFRALVLLVGMLLAPPGCTCRPAIVSERVVPLQREVYAADVKAALTSVEKLSYDHFTASAEHESFGIFPRWGTQIEVSPAYHRFHTDRLEGQAWHDDPSRNVAVELWPRGEDRLSRGKAKALRDEGEALLDRIEAHLRRWPGE